MVYDLEQVAMITGFTTRTLRSHISRGLLAGEKAEGRWRFTSEALDSYMSDPAVGRQIRSNHRSLIYDFLSAPVRTEDRVCTVMDFPVTEEARRIAVFFSALMTERGKDMEFRYIAEKHFARFILTGPIDAVADFMRAYRERKEQE